MAFAPMIGMAATAAGTVVQMIGQSEKAKADKARAEYLAQIAENRAQYERQAGEQKELASGLEGAERLGRIRNAMAGSGLEIGTGTFANVESSQKDVQAYNQRLIRQRTDQDVYRLREEAKLQRYSGEYAESAGNIAMLGTAISGVGTVASRWYQGQSLNMLS